MARWRSGNPSAALRARVAGLITKEISNVKLVEWRGGEVVTRGSAKPLCEGPIPFRASCIMYIFFTVLVSILHTRG